MATIQTVMRNDDPGHFFWAILFDYGATYTKGSGAPEPTSSDDLITP